MICTNSAPLSRGWGRAGQMHETGSQVAAIHSEFERVRVALLAEVC